MKIHITFVKFKESKKHAYIITITDVNRLISRLSSIIHFLLLFIKMSNNKFDSYLI